MSYEHIHQTQFKPHYICIDEAFMSSANAIEDLQVRWELLQEYFDIIVNKKEGNHTNPTIKAILAGLRVVANKRIQNYINGCKGAEHGIKGAEHGIKGGRPRKQQSDTIININEEQKPTKTSCFTNKTIQNYLTSGVVYSDSPQKEYRNNIKINDNYMESVVDIFTQAHRKADLNMPNNFISNSNEDKKRVLVFIDKFMNIESGMIISYNIDNINISRDDFILLISDILCEKNNDGNPIKRFSYFYNNDATKGNNFGVIIEKYQQKHQKTTRQIRDDNNLHDFNHKLEKIRTSELDIINNIIKDTIKKYIPAHKKYIIDWLPLIYCIETTGDGNIFLYDSSIIGGLNSLKLDLQCILYDKSDEIINRYPALEAISSRCKFIEINEYLENKNRLVSTYRAEQIMMAN